MQTLADAHADDLAISMMVALMLLALYALYCVKSNKETDLRVVATIMIVVIVVTVSFQKYDYSIEESSVLEKFRSGDDIVCKFNENSNIVISKKRGYELKSKFFIKDEMAIKQGSCYLVE